MTSPGHRINPILYGWIFYTIFLGCAFCILYGNTNPGPIIRVGSCNPLYLCSSIPYSSLRDLKVAPWLVRDRPAFVPMITWSHMHNETRIATIFYTIRLQGIEDWHISIISPGRIWPYSPGWPGPIWILISNMWNWYSYKESIRPPFIISLPLWNVGNWSTPHT